MSKSGLVTVTGGKWTTYRAMAQDVLQRCVDQKLLPESIGEKTGATKHLLLIGAANSAGAQMSISQSPGAHLYGSEADLLASLEGHEEVITPGLTAAMVRFAVRYEYARTVEDVLARRSRLLFLDARLAMSVAPRIAQIVQSETRNDPQLDTFVALARGYVL